MADDSLKVGDTVYVDVPEGWAYVAKYLGPSDEVDCSESYYRPTSKLLVLSVVRLAPYYNTLIAPGMRKPAILNDLIQLLTPELEKKLLLEKMTDA